jgi:hypothetical protein
LAIPNANKNDSIQGQGIWSKMMSAGVQANSTGMLPNQKVKKVE